MRKFSRFIAVVLTIAGMLGACQGPAIAAELDGTGIIYLPSLVDVKTEQADGRQYLIKTYEAAPEYGADYSELIEEPFEQDGLLYTFQYASFNDVMKTDRKWERDEVNFPVDNEDLSPVFQRLEPSIPYTGEDGYAGTLDLDRGAVWVQIMAYTHKSYTLTDTVTMAELSSNDTSNIPKTREKSGVTMTLENVDWTVQESTNIGYDTVPTKYTATAHYSGAYSKKVPSEYLARAWYGGYVEKNSVDKVVLSVTYAAELPPAAKTETETDTAAEPASEPLTEAGTEGVSETATEEESAVDADVTDDTPDTQLSITEPVEAASAASPVEVKPEVVPSLSEAEDEQNGKDGENDETNADADREGVLFPVIAAIIILAILAIVAYFNWFNVFVNVGDDHEGFKLIAKRRISPYNPVVNLRRLNLSGRLVINLTDRAAAKLKGQEIRTIINDDFTSVDMVKRARNFRYVLNIPERSTVSRGSGASKT